MTPIAHVLPEDLEAALRRLDTMVDVTTEDLMRIINLTLEETEKRMRTFEGKEWIGQIMSSPVITCPPHTPVEEAARILVERDIHCLPVVAEGDKLVGIVTESDLMFQFSPPPAGGSLKELFSRRRVHRQGRLVGEVMVGRVAVAHPEDPIQKAIQLMLKHGYGRIPVTDRENTLVGIIARKDILHFLK